MPYINRTYYCSVCQVGYDTYHEAGMCELKDRGVVDKLKEIVRLVEEFNKLISFEKGKIKIGGYFSHYDTCVTSLAICDIEEAEKDDKYSFFKEGRVLLLNKKTTFLLDKAYKEIEDDNKRNERTDHDVYR